MNQEWFEMASVRKRWLANSVWIPLRAVNRIEETGQYGSVGYRQEFYGAGTLAVPIDAKEKAEELGWMDIGISHEHGSYVDSGRYIPCDVYEHYSGELKGIALALVQRGNSEEFSQWHLHQDFVIALGLKRENDTWVCPDEGYTEVARLVRHPDDGRPYLLEVKAEYLRDYLCARNMALYITSYRNREEIVEDASHITWEDNLKSEIAGGDRWEGRVDAIHEGGIPFGAETAIIHAERTDVDPQEDVPTFGFPTDDNLVSKSWTKKDKGKKVFRVQGELWRNEWVDPGEYSLRIRRDKLPATVFFITDASGKRESKDSLVDGGRWLWFKPEVMMALAHRRGGSLQWYTRDTGSVRCSPDYNIHFGINKLSLINVYAKDIALLPEWQQRIWAGFNVGPEGGVSEELLASQMKAMPAHTQAPEAFLSKAYSYVNDAVRSTLGEPLFREHEQYPKIMRHAHRFRATDQSGLLALAKDLARLTADSIDTRVLQKIVSPPKGVKWGSLKSLEKVLATVIPAEDARSLLSPLVGIYELRHADAHLPSGKIEEILKLAGADPAAIPVQQGYQLICACVSSLYQIADIISKVKGRRK
jgi:hypothetical protein